MIMDAAQKVGRIRFVISEMIEQIWGIHLMLDMDLLCHCYAMFLIKVKGNFKGNSATLILDSTINSRFLFTSNEMGYCIVKRKEVP